MLSELELLQGYQVNKLTEPDLSHPPRKFSPFSHLASGGLKLSVSQFLPQGLPFQSIPVPDLPVNFLSSFKLPWAQRAGMMNGNAAQGQFPFKQVNLKEGILDIVLPLPEFKARPTRSTSTPWVCGMDTCLPLR